MRPAYDCDSAPRTGDSCQDAQDEIDQERALATARRKRLSASAQRECDSVKAAISANDEVEQRADARGLMESLQQDTLSLRKRYQELGC